jgi:SAM-dependent methyltransferase
VTVRDLRTLRRSVDLFRAFRGEQSDPDGFYSLLAEDSVEQVSGFCDLDGADLLDVGGGPGYFASAFSARGCRYAALDADVGELAARGRPGPGTVLGSGMSLPFADGSFDVTYSSNVLEHVKKPWVMADEMARVTRTGGTVFISYTLWLSPHGGHETSPWHYLGGHRARRRYEMRAGHHPKNVFGESLFAVSAGAGLRWARSHGDLELVTAFPRYLPWWATPVLRVPGAREVLTWNLALVLRRR